MLRRINLLYLAIPFLCWGLWGIFKHISRSTATFYGFAENNETSINLDHPLVVNKIYVKPGQFVTKGTLMLEVSRIALDFKMNELSSNITQIESSNAWRVAELRARMEQIRSEKAEKVGNLVSNIRILESELAMNRRLINGLQTVQSSDTIGLKNSPAQAKINALREEINLVTEPYDKELTTLSQEIQLAGKPKETEIGRLKNEVNLYKKEQGRLSIYAPTDGLIGNIHCKEGENIADFTTLISFYEQNPNMVVGYVHESLSLKINIGDSLKVISSLHPSEQSMGVISGLGHRIIEIPERLRKIPELRTYGREVLIEIPRNNHFLQKEKVLLQWPDQALNPFQSMFTEKK
jgi:multidrug resistance efflux pump